MPDVFTLKKRREIMQAIRCKDTAPEMFVRRLIHSLGYRYRLHDKKLPGNPDMVFPGRKKVIFIHGCYWHRHNCKKGRSVPKSNVDFWEKKFEANRDRDVRNQKILRKDGWSVMTIWQCQITSSNLEELKIEIQKFLNDPRNAKGPGLSI